MDIRVSLSIGYPGSEHKDIIEIDDEGLEGLTEEERNRVIDDAVKEWAWNYIELDWEKK